MRRRCLQEYSNRTRVLPPSPLGSGDDGPSWILCIGREGGGAAREHGPSERAKAKRACDVFGRMEGGRQQKSLIHEATSRDVLSSLSPSNLFDDIQLKEYDKVLLRISSLRILSVSRPFLRRLLRRRGHRQVMQHPVQVGPERVPAVFDPTRRAAAALGHEVSLDLPLERVVPVIFDGVVRPSTTSKTRM